MRKSRSCKRHPEDLRQSGDNTDHGQEVGLFKGTSVTLAPKVGFFWFTIAE